MARIIKPFTKSPPEVKKPHIISRFLLSRFADREQYFWRFQRGRPARRVSTKSQATESGYFGTMDRQLGSQLETWLSSLETMAARLVDRLDKRTWGLDEMERATLMLFVATLFYRSKKIRILAQLPHVRHTLESQVTPDNIREHQHRLLKTGVLVEADMLRRGISAHIDAIVGDPAQIQFTDFFSRSMKLADKLSQKGFHIIRSDSNAFITSDAPVFPMTVPADAPARTGGALDAPRTAVFLALSPRTLLVIGPANTGWAEVASPEFINDLQQATIEAADRSVYAFDRWTRLQADVDAHLGAFVYHAGLEGSSTD